MTMLERVARALCSADGLDPDLDWSGPDDRWQPNWHEYRDFARAAVAVLREPTEGMLKEGWGETLSGWYGSKDDLADPWRAMIDAILSEQPE